MKHAESDFREVRNNTQVSEQAAAQIVAVGRMADELYASGVGKKPMIGGQSKCTGESAIKKCLPQMGGGNDDHSMGRDSDEDDDMNRDGEHGDDEDFDGDEDDSEDDMSRDGEDDGDEDFDGDVKGGKGKEDYRCKDGGQHNENEKGELKKNFNGQDLQGAVGDGSVRGELKQNFNGNDRPVEGDRENRDHNSGSRNWPRSFRDNDESLPPSLYMDSPYQTFTA